MALQLRLRSANAAAAALCFAACEGYDVMLMTDGHHTTSSGRGGKGWMLCQQDKARGRVVEKVRRLTYAHGWQCAHKLIIMGIAFVFGHWWRGACYTATIVMSNATEFFLGTPSVLLQRVLFLLSQ